MHRNDLIVFEFANPNSRQEVLLDPQIVVDLKNFLHECVLVLATDEGVREHFDVMLAGVERGSIKIGFLLRFMQTANVIGDFEDHAARFIFAAGIALGHLSAQPGFTQTEAAKPSNVEACGAAFYKLVRVAARSGAEEVTVSIAGCGTASIINQTSTDTELIGISGATRAPIHYGNYSGNLSNIEGPFELRRKTDEGFVSYYTGQIDSATGEQIPVILLWASKRSIKDAIAAGVITVSGQTMPLSEFDPKGMSSNKPIDPALRRVAAFLRVSGQTVSE